jgi:hypothetical protein
VTVTGGALRGKTDNSTDEAAWVPLATLDAVNTVRLVRWARSLTGNRRSSEDF